MARPLPGNTSPCVTFSEPPASSRAAESEARVTTTPDAPGLQTPRAITCAPPASLIPAIPPAARPCGRTDGRREAQQLGVVGEQHELVVVGDRQGPDDDVAVGQPDDLPRVPVGRRLVGHPLDDPGRRWPGPGWGHRGAGSPGRSRTRRARGSGTPPAGPHRPGSPDLRCPGRLGRSSTWARTTRPAEVTTPTWPRTVALARATTTSCVPRGPVRGARLGRPAPSGSGSARRAMRPVLDSSTSHGSSDSSSGAAVAAAPRTGAGPSSSTVRRGVAWASATSASSAETRSLQRVRVVEQPVELGDGAVQVVALGLELDPAELGQPAQRHLEDVVGLHLGQVEHAHQAGPGRGGVVAGADDGDDLVDVEDRDEQALDQVQPVGGLRAGGTGCAGARPPAGGRGRPRAAA